MTDDQLQDFARRYTARLAGDRAVYLWTYEGSNSGPGGTRHAVRFSG